MMNISICCPISERQRDLSSIQCIAMDNDHGSEVACQTAEVILMFTMRPMGTLGVLTKMPVRFPKGWVRSTRRKGCSKFFRNLRSD